MSEFGCCERVQILPINWNTPQCSWTVCHLATKAQRRKALVRYRGVARKNYEIIKFLKNDEKFTCTLTPVYIPL